MYDSAAKTTNNKVRTSIVFIGHHPPLRLEGITNRNRTRFLSTIQEKYTIKQTGVQEKRLKIGDSGCIIEKTRVIWHKVR